MEAEIGVMLLQAKEPPARITSNPQKLGERTGTDHSLAPPEGANPANALTSDC